MRALRTVMLGALVGSLVLASMALPLPAFADSEHDVNISVDLAHGFSPQQASTHTGTTVVWTNIEKLDYPTLRGAHTVVADDGSFSSPEIAPGSSWAQTFLAPGTYAYHCSIHPSLLHGTLVVSGPKIEPERNQINVAIIEPGGNVENAGYDPRDVTGKPGLTITWRNEGAQAHTVTVDGLFDSGEIQPGKTWTHAFPAAASVAYYCTIHPWMKATVRIAAAGGKAPPLPVRSRSGSSKAIPAPQQPQRGTGPITLRVNIVEPDAGDPRSWGFSPPLLHARVGDTVLWVNTGIAPHTVTATDRAFDSGSVAAQATFAFHPLRTGTVGYFCSFHPWMKAMLQVLPRGTSGTRVLALQRAAPSPVSVSQGSASSARGDMKPSGDTRSRGRIMWIVLGAILFLELLTVIPALFTKSHATLDTRVDEDADASGNHEELARMR